MRIARVGWIPVVLVALFMMPLPAIGQHGGGEGGGCGDVFGDLIHIQRDDETGQPILAKRWVELPAEVPGYGWGYCPIAVDENGEELAFAPLSCEVHEDDAEQVVAVDYFGRLNGGRTKPRNQRMHFNEVIDNIKAACMVKQEETGRLKIGYCDDEGDLEEWAIVDSPMESMGLYIRSMKYGHLQTNPNEVDYWAHGDPATLPQLQPALGPEDWLKFHKSVQHLLPKWPGGDALKPTTAWTENQWIAYCFTDDDGDGRYEVIEPFTDENRSGFYDVGEPFSDFDRDGERDDTTETFNPECADHQELSNEDFIRSASFLSGAASKTGVITGDLVQYFNRIGKVLDTGGFTLGPLRTLPALVRVCDTTPPESELEADSEDQVELWYENCTEVVVDPTDPDSFPNLGLFPDALERFVDYSNVDYVREDWRYETVEGIFPVDASAGTWQEFSRRVESVVQLFGWLVYENGEVDAEAFDGFVGAARDGVRAIEFVHNYALPVDMWPGYRDSVEYGGGPDSP